ncbi:MAG: trimethylamine methyltransferase family protein [Candidatus Bathyarchaeia archaeon]
MLEGFIRKIKPLEILSNEEIEYIHESTLEVLETTGVNFFHEKALNLFKKNGCEVVGNRVKFPSWLIEECLRKTPSNFKVRARDPKNDLRIGGNRLYFMSGAAMRIVDPETWEARPATLKELDEAIIVVDALNTAHLIPDTAPYTELVEIPHILAPIVIIASHLKNSTKVTCSAYGFDSEIFQIKMAKILGVDMLAFLGASSPLTYYKDACEAVFRYAEAKFPFYIVASDVMGGTGPATIAGSLVTTNAEILAGLTLIQLIKPGTGIVAGDYTMPLNMRSGHPCFGDLASSLHTVAFNQIMRRYKIPTFANCPGFSSSKKIDFQAGYERALSTLTAVLSGANIIVLHGSIYGEYTFHPIQAILDDDVANWVGHFIEGIEVTKETLAVDLINKVGPIPGSYLGEEHTRKWWKTQQLIPNAADRSTYPEWISEGKKTCLEYAKARIEEILRTHKVPSLSEDQDEEINNIIKEAEKYYREKGML